jgi:hypothetical protein
MKIFVFVIASFEESCYFDMIAMRKLQLEKHKIPHLFIFNEKHELYKSNENDLFLKKPYHDNIPNPHLNPHMLLKFINGIQNFNENEYDYILRVNVSTFINFNQLSCLESLAKTKLLAGHMMKFLLSDWDIYNTKPIKFVAGTCMIFSPDVIGYLKTIELNNPLLYKHNDDTVLSHLVFQYTSHLTPINMLFIEHSSHRYDDILYKNNFLVRIKHHDDRNLDVKMWNHLLYINDEIVYIKQRQALPRLFIFWTGDNPLTNNRYKAIENIKSKTDITVILITKDNLCDWILKDYPLHSAYQYLSSVHKADYLRCYFMHHYGGGYADIKCQSGSWLQNFKKLNTSNYVACGYQEVDGGVAAVKNTELYNEMCKNYSDLIGNCAYIFKPRTFLTEKWYMQLHKLLNEKLEQLKINPAQHDRDYRGLLLNHGINDINDINEISQKSHRPSKYPLAWSEMLGQLFHPLVYHYKNYILKDLPSPIFQNYL